jgi:hypothetical protein
MKRNMKYRVRWWLRLMRVRWMMRRIQFCIIIFSRSSDDDNWYDSRPYELRYHDHRA